MRLASATAALAASFLVWHEAAAVLISSTHAPLAIPDSPGGPLNATISVAESLVLTDVELHIVDLRMTWDDDLDIFLISPLGTIVEISTDNGSSGDHYLNTIFDDSATTAITAGAAPFTGTFRPEGLLSALNGQDARGLWTLQIRDDSSAITGTLNSWALNLTGRAATPIPEPGTLLLVGAGLLGVALTLRRRAAA